VSDDSVRAAIRSDAQFVVIEAPAGCGKTTCAAEYAQDIARGVVRTRPLILPHTHAACSVFASRARGLASRMEIRTIDSLIANIASAYHVGLGLPKDIQQWIRQGNKRHEKLASKVATLLNQHPIIPVSLAQRHQTVICDEHQDSGSAQHSIVMSLGAMGAKLRVFADPMQRIFGSDSSTGAGYSWQELTQVAHAFEQLDTPHRWKSGCIQLGNWTLAARRNLADGRPINLHAGLPPSVTVVFAENQSDSRFNYRLSYSDRKPIDEFEQREQNSLLILTHYNETAESFRSLFHRRISLWEGHTRDSLEKLVNKINVFTGDSESLGKALVEFMGEVGKGFSQSKFGDRLLAEIRNNCTKKSSGKPAAIQEIAKILLSESDHHGVAKALRRTFELKKERKDFANIEIDRLKEFSEAVRLDSFATAEEGLTGIMHHRTYSRPHPPGRAISTIHKAKGLECESVILMPCDAHTFPDKDVARCLLYVALSRARSRLLLVLSRNKPSPLFVF